MSLLSRGSRGAEVKKVQEELNRQVFPSPNLVADGDFGRLTDVAVRAFQKNSGLVVDGIVGPRTKAALGMPDTGKKFTHRVRLNFRSISLTNVPFNSILAHTQTVYAPHGIKIEFAGGMSLGLDAAAAQQLVQIDGTCTWKITDGEFASLLRLGPGIPATDVGVFYVDRFSQPINGCGGHMANKPACIVAKTGTRYSTAHEIGHVLLGSSFVPVHVNDVKNLMYPSGIPHARTPELTAAQVARIKKSPLCVAI